jgi:hypothetical protein
MGIRMTFLGRVLCPPAALGLALALSACGAKPESGPAAATADDAAPLEAVDATFGGGTEGAAAGGITAVDAARGGGTLPADSYGPSAYDLARARGDRQEERADTPEDAPAEAARPGSAADLPRPSDDVTVAPPATPAVDPAPRP